MPIEPRVDRTVRGPADGRCHRPAWRCY